MSLGFCRQTEIADEALAELRAAMRQARWAGAGADEGREEEEEGGLSRQARRRLAARQRVVEARRLKRERARARAVFLALEAEKGEEEEERREKRDAEAGGEGGGEGDEEEAVEEECAICLIDLGVEGGREELPCRHAYHAECLAAWRGACAAKNLVRACPYCRAVFE